MTTRDDSVFRFGDFELDPRERRLLEGFDPVPLTPKVFQTLVLLVTNAGRLLTKEELMSSLWPRGYVDESNLVTNIWQIRRALRESSSAEKFVETVPKLGYRFIAPVQVVQRTATVAEDTRASVDAMSVVDAVKTVDMAAIERTPTGDPPPASLGRGPDPIPDPGPIPKGETRSTQRPLDRRLLPWVLVAAAAILLIFVAAIRRTATTPSSPPEPGRRVALLGFRNLSQDPKYAWLDPAIKEMLSTQLGARVEISIVPDELVQDATRGFADPSVGGYGPETLGKLRNRLGADVVVSGGYLVMARGQETLLRLDVAAQDLRTGRSLGSTSTQSGIEALDTLVTQIGADLDARLGIPRPAGELAAQIASALPPNTDVARHLGLGLNALQRHDAAKARDELLEVLAQAPHFALAYGYLSQAWLALGYQQKALAAAEQAERQAASLPPAEAIPIHAALQASRYDWAGAATSWKSLVELQPQVIEPRLELLAAEKAGGAIKEAQSALQELRRLPAAAGDPRIELVAADLADFTSDPKSGFEHGQLALQLATRREAPGLVAEAHQRLAWSAWHLGNLEPAAADALAAITGYAAIGNPLGEARARVLLASVRHDQHDETRAQTETAAALRIFQQIGDLQGVADVYRHQGETLWDGGDRDGAQIAIRHALAISREIGNLKLQAWTLVALATIESDEAATDEAIAKYREAIELEQKVGGLDAGAFDSAMYADAARLRGELGTAETVCERALPAAGRSTDPQQWIQVGFSCALVHFDRGDTERSTQLLKDVLERATVTAGFEVYVGNVHLILAQSAMDRSDWAAACDELRLAITEFLAAASPTGEADAQAQLALAEHHLGDLSAREVAAARARTLRSAITSKQEIFGVDIALAQLADSADKRQDSIARLLALAHDAERRHWMSWSLEAKLAAWHMEPHERDARADVLRHDLESDAQRNGFARVVRLVHAAPERGH